MRNLFILAFIGLLLTISGCTIASETCTELIVAMILSLLLGFLKPYLRMPLLIAIVFGLLNVAQQAEAKGLSCEKAVRLLLKKEKLNPKVASIYFSKCQKSKKGTELQWHRRYQAAKKLLTSMESLKGSSWRFCDDQTGYHIDTCHEHLRRAIKILDIKVLQLGNKWWDKKEEKRKKWEKKHRENNEREMKKLLEKGRKETKEAEKLIEKLKL